MISEKESIIKIQEEEINLLKTLNCELQKDLNRIKSIFFKKDFRTVRVIALIKRCSAKKTKQRKAVIVVKSPVVV